MKILFFNNIITPTNTPLFNGLFQFFQKRNDEFKVIFTSASESNRSYDTSKEEKKFLFDYTILSNKKIKLNSNKDNHFFHFNFKLSELLDKEKPDIIIHGWWAGLSAWTSLWWCKKNNAKYILWSGSTLYENSWRRTLTKPIVKYLINKADWFLSYWTRASEYLISLWAKKENIQPMYNTVNIDYYIEQSNLLKERKIELKEKYWVTTKYVLLFVGRFMKWKGIYTTLFWFQEYQKLNPDISLIFVGNGEELEKLEQIILTENIKNVIFPGFIQMDQISELYTIADIFTLPSEEEIWGLVINEAMCFWLPIITSNEVGAHVDLIKEWENGYILKENTALGFYEWLKYVFDHWLLKNNTSLQKIKEFKIDKILKNIRI